MAALRQIADGLALLNGEADALFSVMEEPAEGHPPRGRAAIPAIVGERPGIRTLADLREEMKARGWWTCDEGVEAAVHRTRPCRVRERAAAHLQRWPGAEGLRRSGCLVGPPLGGLDAQGRRLYGYRIHAAVCDKTGLPLGWRG
jgi:hypothetical protein